MAQRQPRLLVLFLDRSSATYLDNDGKPLTLYQLPAGGAVHSRP